MIYIYFSVKQYNFSQTQHTCISEKLISIQEQMTEITSIDQDIMWNDGFGESNEMKMTTLDEFLPHRNFCIKLIYSAIMFSINICSLF